MGFCRSGLQMCGYTGIVLVAVLVFFHMECRREKEENIKNKTNQEFKPEITECSDISFKFYKKGVDIEFTMGVKYMLIQLSPCALRKLVTYVGVAAGSTIDIATGNTIETDEHNVTILDAREANPGSFHETGFTLISLDTEPTTTDWRDEPDVVHFQKQMEPHLKKLYPETKKIMWTYNVVRGGDSFTDQPKTDGNPHLDFYQGDEARKEFHNEYPAMYPMMLGEFDDDDHKFGVHLGVWKPLYPAKVCDYPLAVMDARSFQPENMSQNKFHMYLPGMELHNLNGAISYDENQKWYYYSHQTPLEVLVFHHYSKGTWLNNPHSSFLNKNCPKDSGERISVELRVGLFF